MNIKYIRSMGEHYNNSQHDYYRTIDEARNGVSIEQGKQIARHGYVKKTFCQWVKMLEVIRKSKEAEKNEN